MDFVSAINPLYSASGFVVGVLVGMTGVGGGSLMTPLLILLFGIHPATAVGTDLLYAAITKSGGSLVHGFNRTVDWRLVARLASGSVPATVVTLLTLSRIGLGDSTTRAISMSLGIALIVTAGVLLFRTRLLRLYAARLGVLSPRLTANLTVAFGAGLGVLVTLSSVGAGAIGVTVLLMLYPRMPTVRIVGSDIAHAVPLTLVAGIGHWILGSLDWHLLTSLLTGSLPGIFLGSYLSGKVPDAVLRPVLAAVLLVAASRLVL
jgi:uncharacterized membrane protein YfcA